MLRSSWPWWGVGVVLAAAVGGCRSDPSPPTGTDLDTGSSVLDATTDVPVAPVDVHGNVDVGTTADAGTTSDVGSSPRDAGAATVSMATLTNPMAAGHPAVATIVTLSDTNLVALSTRLFISGPSTTGMCSYAAWVGTSTGGDFSAVELFEALPAAPGDGGTGDCFAHSVVGTIPADLAIGDTFSTVRGKVDPYCPRGTTCPVGTSFEFGVAASAGGVLTVSGHGGTVPAPTVVHVSDINGTGTTLGPRDLALQNVLVQINGATVQTVPTTANHDALTVADTTGAGAPGIPVAVARYRGVTCQRTALGTAAPGAAVGTVIGLLEYSFGVWQIQPRQPSDLPGVVCAGDAGVATDAGVTTDAH